MAIHFWNAHPISAQIKWFIQNTSDNHKQYFSRWSVWDRSFLQHLQSSSLQFPGKCWSSLTFTWLGCQSVSLIPRKVIIGREESFDSLLTWNCNTHCFCLFWLDSGELEVNSWLLEEKGMTEDEMAGWHHQLDGQEFEEAPGVGDGQGRLVCCSPWGRKESDTTEWLNWTGLPWWFSGEESICQCKRHGFNPSSGKIPHASEQLSQCPTTIESVL